MIRLTPVAVLAALLVALGLAQTVGEYAGWRPLWALGRVSAASPLPRPFVPHRGLEFWRNRVEVRWWTRSGSEGHAPLDRSVYRRIPGPHVVPVAYSYPFTVAPRLTRRIWRPPLIHGFCDGGLLARAFRIEEPVARVEVEIANPALPEPWRTEIACP